jgi:hypothetical protein
LTQSIIALFGRSLAFFGWSGSIRDGTVSIDVYTAFFGARQSFMLRVATQVIIGSVGIVGGETRSSVFAPGAFGLFRPIAHTPFPVQFFKAVSH